MLPPLIGVIVVNYFGGDRTIECLEAVEKSTWPADRLRVVLVDNGSPPGYLSDVRDRFPRVRIVEAGANLGFGGANNLGFQATRDCDYVALLNNDATPDPGWLEPLVAVLEQRPDVGAAMPKVLLDAHFVTVQLRSPTTRAVPRDPRELGVQLCGARVGRIDVSDRVELASGFWGWEYDPVTVSGTFAWTNGAALALFPVDDATADDLAVWVRLACGPGPTTAKIVLAGEQETTAAVGVRPSWIEVGRAQPTARILNSCGLALHLDGSAADRGYLEADDGRYDHQSEAFGWSGAAVLVSRRYLDDVGDFDARLFLYYEDVDLSWRGRLLGWTYQYVPEAVVRHEHSATVGARSPLARHLSERNRLVVLTKLAPWRLAVRALWFHITSVTDAARRDLLGSAIRWQRPVVIHMVRELRVLLGLGRLLPYALNARRDIRRSARVHDQQVLQLVEGVDGPPPLRLDRRARRKRLHADRS